MKRREVWNVDDLFKTKRGGGDFWGTSGGVQRYYIILGLGLLLIVFVGVASLCFLVLSGPIVHGAGIVVLLRWINVVLLLLVTAGVPGRRRFTPSLLLLLLWRLLVRVPHSVTVRVVWHVVPHVVRVRHHSRVRVLLWVRVVRRHVVHVCHTAIVHLVWLLLMLHLLLLLLLLNIVVVAAAVVIIIIIVIVIVIIVVRGSLFGRRVRNAIVVVLRRVATQRIRSVRVWDASMLLRLLGVVFSVHIRATLVVRASVGLRHAVVEVVVLSACAVLLESAHGADLRVAGGRADVATRSVGKRTLVHVHPANSTHWIDTVRLHFVLIELVLLVLVLLIVVVVLLVSDVIHLLPILLLLMISRLRLLTTSLLLRLLLRFWHRFLSTLLRRRRLRRRLRSGTVLLLLVWRAPGAGGAFRCRRRLRRATCRSLRSILR